MFWVWGDAYSSFQIDRLLSKTKYILTWCTGYGSLKYGWEFGEEKFRQHLSRNIHWLKKQISEARDVRSTDVSLLPTGIIWAQSQSLTPSCSIREQSNWRKSQPNAGLSRDMSTGWWSLLLTITTTSLRLKSWQAEWSTLIGPDHRDTVLSLVEPYYAGAKIYMP